METFIEIPATSTQRIIGSESWNLNDGGGRRRILKGKQNGGHKIYSVKKVKISRQGEHDRNMIEKDMVRIGWVGRRGGWKTAERRKKMDKEESME